jgi:hypothetical protein
MKAILELLRRRQPQPPVLLKDGRQNMIMAKRLARHAERPVIRPSQTQKPRVHEY